MIHANLARPTHPSRPVRQEAPQSRCGIAPHRGDVTTVLAAQSVRLGDAKHIEKVQAHAPSHRTAGTTPVPVLVPGRGRA